MTDRELLKAAAKAAGYKGKWDAAWWDMCGRENHWDPLRHSEQALILALKLNIDVGLDAEKRRAIVMAAASLKEPT